MTLSEVFIKSYRLQRRTIILSASCVFLVLSQLIFTPVHAAGSDGGTANDDLATQILQHLSGGNQGEAARQTQQGHSEIQFAEMAYDFLQKNMFDEALNAVDGALVSYPQSADLLSIKAETMAMMNDGSMMGEPFNLIERALNINGGHRHGLWLAAVANRQFGNYEASFLLLEKLKSRYATDSESFRMVVETQSLLKKDLDSEFVANFDKNSTGESGPVDSDNSSSSGLMAHGSSVNDSGKSLHVSIDISEAARSRFTDNTIVFVYAKSTEQSRMPLAVAKTSLGSLPTTVVLDSSMSMMPDLSLDDADSVTVGARVSREGTALAFAGDWQDEAHGIELTGLVETSLYINTLIK